MRSGGITLPVKRLPCGRIDEGRGARHGQSSVWEKSPARSRAVGIRADCVVTFVVDAPW